MTLKDLLQQDLNRIHESILINSSLRENIKQFLSVHEISKTDVMDVCNISEDQYYRRINKPSLFTDTDLQKLLKHIISIPS